MKIFSGAGRSEQKECSNCFCPNEEEDDLFPQSKFQFSGDGDADDAGSSSIPLSHCTRDSTSNNEKGIRPLLTPSLKKSAVIFSVKTKSEQTSGLSTAENPRKHRNRLATTPNPSKAFARPGPNESQQNKINCIINVNLGNIKRAQGDFKSAKDFYVKASELNPSNKHALTSLALVCYESNDFDAIHENAYLKVASSYQKKEMYQAAIDMYKAALLCNPSNSKAFFELGVIYETIGKSDLSNQSFQHASLLDSLADAM